MLKDVGAKRASEYHCAQITAIKGSLRSSSKASGGDAGVAGLCRGHSTPVLVIRSSVVAVVDLVGGCKFLETELISARVESRHVRHLGRCGGCPSP